MVYLFLWTFPRSGNAWNLAYFCNRTFAYVNCSRPSLQSIIISLSEGCVVYRKVLYQVIYLATLLFLKIHQLQVWVHDSPDTYDSFRIQAHNLDRINLTCWTGSRLFICNRIPLNVIKFETSCFLSTMTLLNIGNTMDHETYFVCVQSATENLFVFGYLRSGDTMD